MSSKYKLKNFVTWFTNPYVFCYKADLYLYLFNVFYGDVYWLPVD